MKNWFNNLEEKYKKIIVWATWIGCIVSMFIVGAIPEASWDNTIFDDLFTWLFLIFLVFAIIFTVWKVKYKNTGKEESNNFQNQEKIKEAKTPTLKNDIIPIQTENNALLTTEKFINANLTFIDVETPNRSNNRICSIAIINKVNGKTKYKQNLYVNPEARFDALNMQIHGITPQMVENAPKFNEIWKDISKYFLNSIIIGHGVQSDLAIISKTLKNYGLNLNTISFIDTYTLAKKYISAKSYKLSELTKEFNCESQAHDALSDCIDCENLLNKIVEDNNLDLYSETEEYYIQHKEVGQPTIYGGIRNTKETKAYQKLQSSISKILEDDNVSNDELQQFIKDVENNNLQDTYPIDKTYKIAIEKLNNADVDIKKSLTTITGGIDNDTFEGDFEGKLFCLTGDFNHGAKNEIADYIISKGGFVKDSLTLKVDYLVRGLQGSEAYAYGSYGSKVKKALEMKEKGYNIKIITEDDLY